MRRGSGRARCALWCGTILTLGVLVFSTLFYQLERNSEGAKERHLRQAAEKYQKRRAKKEWCGRRIGRVVEVELVPSGTAVNFTLQFVIDYGCVSCKGAS